MSLKIKNMSKILEKKTSPLSVLCSFFGRLLLQTITVGEQKVGN